MTRAGVWPRVAFLVAALALAAATAGFSAEPAVPQEEDEEGQSYDEAEHAFLGGPDPPCMLPCALAFLVLYTAVLVAALVLGVALAGVIMVLVVVLSGLCLALAAWLAMQGMWLAAVVVLVPVILGVWLAIAKGRTPPQPDGAAGDDSEA